MKIDPAKLADLLQAAGLPLVVVRCKNNEVSEIVLDKTATKAQYDQAYRIAKGYKPPDEPETVDKKLKKLADKLEARLEALEKKVK